MSPLSLRSRLALLLSWIFLCLTPSEAQPLKVELISQPVLNVSVTARITAAGKVGIENGIKQVSEVLMVSGSQVVNLGTAKTPGFYEFRFRTAEQSEWLVVPVLSDGISEKPKPVALSTAEEEVLIAFLRLHTKARSIENWRKWPMREHVAKNVVNVTTAGVLIVACPFEGVACGPAAVETVNLVFDLAIEFETFQAQEFKRADLLTESQAEAVTTLLKRVKQGKSVLGVRGKIDAAFAAMDLVLLEVDDKDLQIVFGMQLDEAKKARTLITTFKRK